MRIFKKKEKRDAVSMTSDSDELIVKILNNHLDMIRNLRKNEKIICEAITNQQRAINEIKKQIETLQQLIDKAES